MKALKLITTILLVLIIGNCAEPGSEDEIPEVPGPSSLELRIQAAIDNLSSEVPEWNYIYELGEVFDQNEAPKFATRWVQFWKNIPTDLKANMDIWEHYMSDVDATVTPFNTYVIGLEFGQLPQSTDYPITSLDVLDKKLRMIATLMLGEQVAGRRTLFQHSYPDGASDLGFTNEVDFKSYIQNNFRVEKAKEAQMAGSMNLDYYVPFPQSIEGWIDTQGFAVNFTIEQKVDLAQYVLNVIGGELHTSFPGILVVPSGAEYQEANSPWTKLDFSLYDEIHFTVVPSCEATDLHTNLDIQMGNIKEVITKHSQLRWGIAGLAAYEPVLNSCSNTEFGVYQKEVLIDLFGRIDELTQSNPNHAFSGVFADFLTDGNVSVVKDYWAGKPTD